MVLSKHVGPYRNFDTPIDRVNWIFSKEFAETIRNYCCWEHLTPHQREEECWDHLTPHQREEEDLLLQGSGLSNLQFNHGKDPRHFLSSFLVNWFFLSRACYEIHEQYQKTEYGKQKWKIWLVNENIAVVSGLTRIELINL